MTEHAPAGITSLFNQIHAAIPAAINAGIVGDSAHDYGYHRGRNYCTDPDDYSCQLAEDQQGDGEVEQAGGQRQPEGHEEAPAVRCEQVAQSRKSTHALGCPIDVDPTKLHAVMQLNSLMA